MHCHSLVFFAVEPVKELLLPVSGGNQTIK